jgi:hypothetical protein
LPAEILVELRNGCSTEIKGEKLREFLNTERARGHCNTLKQAVSQFPFGLMDLS